MGVVVGEVLWLKRAILLSNLGGTTMSDKSTLAVILLAIPILIAVFIIINPNILLSGGYELALDGYVISRTLMIIFVLSLLFKLGLFLVEQKDK